jgi:hypothetical protein
MERPKFGDNVKHMLSCGDAADDLAVIFGCTAAKQADDVAGLIVELIAEGPEGRTGDDVQVWAGHPTALPPVGLEGRLTMNDLVGKN